jgi:hypothetical protein
MKTLNQFFYSSIVVLISLGLSTSAMAAGKSSVVYEYESVPFEWIDAKTGGETAFKQTPLPLGFEFNFYGVEHSSVQVQPGYITFGELPIGGLTNTSLPDSALPNNLIAPFWDTLTSGFTYVLREGTAPNRRVTIAWENIAVYDPADDESESGRGTFQVTLYEGSNDIVFRYLDVDFFGFGNNFYSNGASATVGIEDGKGKNATLYSYNNPSLHDQTALRFYILEGSSRGR